MATLPPPAVEWEGFEGLRSSISLFMIKPSLANMNFQSDLLRINEITTFVLICVLNPYNVVLTYIRAITDRGSAHAC